MSGCRGVGVSVCRGVGVSGCRGVGVSGCRGVGVSVCRCVGVSVCRCVGVSVCRGVRVEQLEEAWVVNHAARRSNQPNLQKCLQKAFELRPMVGGLLKTHLYFLRIG